MNGSVEWQSWRNKRPEQNISSVSSKISDEERKDPVADPDVLIIEQVRRNILSSKRQKSRKR
jgi:hypothetical protein